MPHRGQRSWATRSITKPKGVPCSLQLSKSSWESESNQINQIIESSDPVIQCCRCGKLVMFDDWRGLIFWSKRCSRAVDRWKLNGSLTYFEMSNCQCIFDISKKLLLQPQSNQLPNECESQKMWYRNARKYKSPACFPNHWWSWSILVGVPQWVEISSGRSFIRIIPRSTKIQG